jgi:hypothetical protein
MNKKKGRDYSGILMIGAALVVIIRYAAAFYASDVGQISGLSSEVTTFFMAVSGIGMGCLVVFGQTYAFDGWRRSLPRPGHRITTRFLLLTLVVVLLVIMDVAILVPFTVSRIRHVSISEVLGEWDWLWSVSVNIAPALLLVGVGLGNQVVSITQLDATQNSANGANGSPNGSREPSRTYSKLNASDKYFILNEKSSKVAREYRVTQRAVQKWRKMVQDEISQGKL